MKYRSAQYRLEDCKKASVNCYAYVIVTEPCEETSFKTIEFDLKIRDKPSKIEGIILSELNKRKIQVNKLKKIN